MLTKNAVGNLINRYKAVLANCRLLNVLGALALAASVAMPTTANAYTIPEPQDAAYTVTAGAIATDETSTAPYYIIFTDKVADADGNITETKYGIQLNKSLVNSTPDLTQTAGDAAINDLILAYDDGTYTIIAGTEEDKTFSLTLPSDTYYFKVMNDGTKVETAIKPESGYNGIFIGNDDIDGGAICNRDTITTISGTFIGNTASSAGGAIYNYGTIDSITNSTFIGNSANNGGAIYNSGGTIGSITDSTFIGNSANDGGAIENYGTIASITNSTFIGNSADYNGGAISNSGTITTIKDSTFIGNSAGTNGGAIRNTGGTIESITDSTFIGNTANYGGAIINSDTIDSIANSTFIGNSAGSGGGAIYNLADITNGITNSTFIGNTAGSGGGAISNSSAIGSITDSIFIGNTANYGGAIYTTKDLTFKATGGDNGDIVFTDNMAGPSESADFNAICVGAADVTLTFNLAGNGDVIMNDGMSGKDDTAYDVAITGTDSTGAFYLNDAMEDVGTLTLSNATLTLGSYTHNNNETTVGTIIAQNLTVNSGGKVTATAVSTNIGATAGDDATGIYAGELEVKDGGLYMAQTVTVSGGSVTVANVTTIGTTSDGTAPSSGLNAKNLTISDGEYNAQGDTSVYTGTLNVTDGTYKAEGATTVSGHVDSGDGNLTVSGGLYNATGQTLTVGNHGKVTATAAGVDTYIGATSVDENTTRGICAGELEVKDGGLYDAHGQTVTVSGGTVTVANDTVIGGTADQFTSLHANSLTVSGGTYTTTGFTEVHNDLTVSDTGTYTATGTTYVYEGGELTVDGGTYTVTGKTYINVGGTLTVSGGTYEAKDNTTVYDDLTVSSGLYNATGQTLTVGNHGKVTATAAGVDTNIGATAGDGYTGVYAGKLQVQSGGLYNASGKTITVASGGKVTATTVATNIGATAGDGTPTGIYAGTLEVQTGGLYNAYGNDITVSGEDTVTVTVADKTTIGGNTGPEDSDTGLYAKTLEVSGGKYATTGKTTVHDGGNLKVTTGGVYNVVSTSATWVTTAVTGADLTASNYAILAIAKADMLTISNQGKLNVASIADTAGANFGAKSLLVVDGLEFSKTGASYALSTATIDVDADAKLLIASSAVTLEDDDTATVKVASATSGLTIDDGAWGYDKDNTDAVDTKTIFTDSTLLGVTGVAYDDTANTYTVTLGKVSAGGVYESMDESLASALGGYKTGGNPFLDKALNPQTADAATGAKSIEGASKPAVASGLGAALGNVGTASVGNIEMRNGSAQVFSENDTRYMLAMDGDGAILPMDKTQEGFGLWFMPMYKHSSADGFESGNYDYGYDTDIYGATLGADYTFASSLRLGLAFNVGTGDSESTGDFDTTKNDFDYFGLTAYGNMHFGKLALSADLGYTASSNDIDQDNTFGHLSADADASLLSFGMKGEYELGFDSFNLTPYAGIRVNYYNIDSFDTKHQGTTTASTAESDYTLVEFPVGLTFDTTLQSGAWDITPSLGLGVKFAAGDLDMDQKVRYTGAQSAVLTSEVADAVTFQGALGLDMAKDAYSLGLAYTLDLSENVQSHGVQVNLRYEF